MMLYLSVDALTPNPQFLSAVDLDPELVFSQCVIKRTLQVYPKFFNSDFKLVLFHNIPILLLTYSSKYNNSHSKFLDL